MKSLFSSLLFCLAFSFGYAQNPLSAKEIMNNAFAQAKKEHKNVFVKFSASWCGWCKKMDASMQDPACKKSFEDNFVIVHLVVDESKDKKNLENPGADDVRIQYNGDNKQGIPFWFILDDKGNLKDNSFVTTTTLEGWFIIEKYCLSTNTTNTNSGFAVFLDKNDCLHIDNYANII